MEGEGLVGEDHLPVDGEPRANRVSGRVRRVARLAALGALTLLVLVACGWSCLALAMDGPGGAAALVYALTAAAALVCVRPWRLGLLACAVTFALVLAWWSSIEPRNDRAWQPEVGRLSAMHADGDRLTVTNLRHFEYRSESAFTPRWEQRTYDLSRVAGIDLFVCDWGDPFIVHTIVSWEFDGDEHLAISIETRKEQGESYSALRGFFRQFELYYVVADERDLIGVRTDVRDERVRLYRLATSPEEARALLLRYAERINRLVDEPAWYNAFTNNCTTSIRLHAVELGIERPWNWRILLNGRGEELLYMRRMVNTSLPFDQLRAQSDITDASRAAAGDPEYSRRIRRELPPRPGGA